MTVMDAVACRGRDSREHVVAGVQPRQSASGLPREQQQGTRGDIVKRVEGGDLGKVAPQCPWFREQLGAL